jgi:hypothetical protein
MARSAALGGLVLLGAGWIGAACSSGDGEYPSGQDTQVDASRPTLVDAAIPRPRPPRPHVRVKDDTDKGSVD